MLYQCGSINIFYILFSATTYGTRVFVSRRGHTRLLHHDLSSVSRAFRKENLSIGQNSSNVLKGQLRSREDYDVMMTSSLTSGRKGSLSFWCFINWACVSSCFINFVSFSRNQENNWNRVIKNLWIWLIHRTCFSKIKLLPVAEFYFRSTSGYAYLSHMAPSMKRPFI